MIALTTLTVHRGTRDRYGDLSSTSTHDVVGCVVAPLTAGEQYGGSADQLSTALSAFAPPGVDITAQDTVTIPGYSGTWQVVGDPQMWPVPAGWQFGTQLHLTKITG